MFFGNVSMKLGVSAILQNFQCLSLLTTGLSHVVLHSCYQGSAGKIQNIRTAFWTESPRPLRWNHRFCESYDLCDV